MFISLSHVVSMQMVLGSAVDAIICFRCRFICMHGSFGHSVQLIVHMLYFCRCICTFVYIMGLYSDLSVQFGAVYFNLLNSFKLPVFFLWGSMYCSVTYCSSMEVWSIEGCVSGSHPCSC